MKTLLIYTCMLGTFGMVCWLAWVVNHGKREREREYWFKPGTGRR